MLLASCWKHYGKLLHLEQYKFSQHSKELLDQYLAGIQFYAANSIGEKSENKDSGTETIKFFLNCLSLLLGRLDSKQFDSVRTEFGPQLSQVLISQLHSIDADVVGDAVCILKAVIFKTTNPRCRGSVFDTSEMHTILPLLFNFLDERDAAARAVATLVGEYCFISSDSRCLQEVLKHLASENSLQRMNALDVISVLSNIALDSGMILEQTIWKDIANNLLQRLGDEELEIQSHASKLITRIDPSLVLPALVRLIYLSDEKMQSTASETLIAMLKYHNQKCEVICMLIDCLSNLCQGLDPPEAADDGRNGQIMDADRVLKLIPEWSKTVGDWNSMIGPLIDKLFLEPSNATIVKFLSSISEFLAEAADVVFRQLLIHTKSQKVIDISFSKWEAGSCSNDDAVKLQNSLFARLCPLLVIRLLPLKVFNDLDSSLMYGELSSQCSIRGTGYFDLDDTRCVAALLLNRAFNNLEFEDVRKLAAELCGRIHPHVLFPIICSQLEHATSDRNVLKIKACLFSICTSLVVRGWNSILYPHILKIRTAIESILLWPSTVGDEVSKAQHGCIDCLALMICMELQAPKSLKGSTSDPTSTVANNGDTSARNLVLTYVIYQLTQDEKILVSHTLGRGECMKQAIAPLQFRLCIANVLISACQKISDSGKKIFAQKVLPRVTSSVEVIEEPEIRAACVQVLFSAVYHLKSAVLPYTSVLLKVSIKSLKKDTQKERMSGAKLLASLMASEEEVVESISGGLLEARSLLSTLSFSDPSSEIQQICQRLLMCLTSS